MRTASLERITAIIGLASVAGFIVWTLMLPGDAPSSADAARRFAAFYSQNRTGTLIAMYTGVLGSGVILAFLAGLRDILRRLDDRDESTAATTGLLAGVLVFAVVSVGMAILAGAAYRPDRPPADTRAMADVGWSVINLGAGPATAVSLAAFSIVIRRSAALPGWVAWLGFGVAAAHLVVAAAFAGSGFFSPQGAISLIVPALFYVWVAAVSLALLRRRLPEEAAAPAPAPS